MRERVNHKSLSKEVTVNNQFWEEYNRRGFKLEPLHGGSFHSEIKKARFTVKGPGQYEIAVEENTRFNIVSASMFMKTVSQIEGLVKYKLFK